MPPFDGSGTYNLYTPGNPVTYNTVISDTWANSTLSDLGTALSTAICKDGQTTTTSNVNFAQGISVATNKFSVAPTTGNTVIAGLTDLSGAAAGQIKFPATQNASADANTLDDYEEGTYTPTATNATGTNTYAGTYTKIGNRVFFEIQITTSSTIGFTGGTTTMTFPTGFTPGKASNVIMSDASTGIGKGTGLVDGTGIYPPTYSSANAATISGSYRV